MGDKPPQPNTTTAPSSPGANSATDSSQAYWKSKLDEQSQADADRRAASVRYQRELFAELKQLSIRAQAGDDAAIVQIEELLDGNEGCWRLFGDAQASTESQLINAIACGLRAIEESIRRHVCEMKRALLGDAPTPIETMAVGRIVACWLYLQLVDRCATLAVQDGSRANDLARLQESAEKRYQTSLKTFKLAQGLGSRTSRTASHRRSSNPAHTALRSTLSTKQPIDGNQSAKNVATPAVTAGEENHVAG